MAAGLVALELAVANRYGWHRDELYFLEAGKHLAWGYIDQPAFVPLVARAADLLASHNLVVLRLLPALAVGGVVVCGAAIARELGGDRDAQLASAVAVACGGFVVGAGHLLSTAVFDLLAWMVLLALAARLLRTDDPRWWLAIGAGGGVALLNKNLPVLLAAALVIALVVDRRWRLLVTPWLPAGAAIALVIAAPHLAWQAEHGWPQTDMARALSERIGAENRVTLLPFQLAFAGPLFALFLLAGARALRASDRHRPLLWAWPVAVVAALAAGGRPYYVVPLTLVVLIAGVTARAPSLRAVTPLAVPNLVLTALIALPLLPVDLAGVPAALNEATAETVGWPELVEQVAAVVGSLPPPEQRRVVLLAATYGEAGAIDRFGGAHGLPPAYSPHNSYADFRTPRDDDATVVAIRFPLPTLEARFEQCRVVTSIAIPHDIDNEAAGTPITVCRGLRAPWSTTWSSLRTVG